MLFSKRSSEMTRLQFDNPLLYWGESDGKEGSAPAVCGGGAGEARKRSAGVVSAGGAVGGPASW